MSVEPDWDQLERSNGSVLCERFLLHKKCSRQSCQWEHSDPKPDQPRPLCFKNIYRKGGCTEGRYCPLSHEKPEGTGITQNPIDSLSPNLINEAQPNNRWNSQSSPRVNQPLRTDALSRVDNGNSNRTNFRVNHNSSCNGPTWPRQDRMQQNGATIGSASEMFRFEDTRIKGARSMMDMHCFQDEGVPLRVSLNGHNGHNGLPRTGHSTNSYSVQNRSSVNFTPTVDRTSGASHGFIPQHHESFVSRNHQARPTNSHPLWNSHGSNRDRSVVSRGLDHDSDSRYRNKPNGMFQQNRIENAVPAQFPADNRITLNEKNRVIPHDPKLPGWQQDPRFGKAHRYNGVNGSTKDIYHSNASQTHDGGANHRVRRNFGNASSVPLGSLGSGNSSAKAPQSNVDNGCSDVGLIREFSESKLKGGGVALGNPSGVGHATREPGAYKTPTTALPRLVERGVGPNGVASAKIPGHSSPGSSTSATSNLRNGISSGDVISELFEKALRLGGDRMPARSEPRLPESVGSKSTEVGGRLTEKNRSGSSDLKRIAVESMGGQATTNQQTKAAVPAGIALERAKNPRLNQVDEIEEIAEICDTEYGEHEEGGAKLPVGGNAQLELSCSQTSASLVGSSQLVSNGVADVFQGVQPPAGPKIWRQNLVNWVQGYSRSGHRPLRRGAQNATGSRPEFTPPFVPATSERRSRDEPISRQYQSVYGHVATRDSTLVNSQLTTCNISLSTNSLPGSIQEQSQGSQSEREATFANQVKSDRHPEISRKPIFRPGNKTYPPSGDIPDTLLKFEPSLDSQENSDDSGPNVYSPDPETEQKRAYTPEPEIEPDSTSCSSEPEIDLTASRLYHEKKRVEAKASGIGHGAWGGTAPPNELGSAKPDLKEVPAIKGDENTRENSLVLAAKLQIPGQFSKSNPPPAEQSLEKETRPTVEEPPRKTVPPVAEQPLKKETRTVAVEPPKRKVTSVPEQVPKKEAWTTVGGPPKMITPSAVGRSSDKETWPAVKKSSKRAVPLVAEKPTERVPSAWKMPLVKKVSPKLSQEVCWLCGDCHQLDGGCQASLKAVGAVKSGGSWASIVDSGDWGYHGNGHVNGWSEEDSGVAISEPQKQSPPKPRHALKKSRIAKDSQSQDKGSVGEEVTGLAKTASKGHRKRKERGQKESRMNGNVERVQPVPEDSAGAPKTDGPRSIMFRADGNHFGRYYNTKLSSIRKLSEDTLHMIFSYVADGLMPEDQMKMKNVHIGSNFRLDASFTTTRYRRLKSVILSCRYWRNLSQHIVYKYVNLDQFGSFKQFVHTISEDPELGRMVHAVKINIQGGASYTTHDNRPSRQELSEMPKSSDSAQLFTSMMESCPELQILSVNMHGAIRGFNFVLTKFLKMREMQIMDDSSKGMVADNLWRSLDNYPNLEKFKIFHSEENGATNFDSLKIPPKNLLSKGSSTMALKALTMERAPELSDKILGVFASRLKQLTHLVIVDCKLVTSTGLARAIQRMQNASQMNRLIYYVWVDPFGKATSREMAPQKDHLCSTIRDYCTGLTYLNWKPYRICGDFWKGSNFRSLKRCRIEPMVFRDCSKDVELRNHSNFMDSYRQAREEERLPELAEDRAVFDFYF